MSLLFCFLLLYVVTVIQIVLQSYIPPPFYTLTVLTPYTAYRLRFKPTASVLGGCGAGSGDCVVLVPAAMLTLQWTSHFRTLIS